ncbi:flagellar biosynthesis protein FlhF-like protein [Henriciella algicola]|uniref:Flagellar biosynthesis protein FlhF-like protein n=2 Tax=Henriciella algicola TaxID=1608422 RepID=A0A399R8E6_9PROT|nr:flagellar biosynthesis protein FlhF-like protein [Henriciella algicola]
MFAAESLEAAKAMIFAEMGDDAIILSEREVPGGVEVRAATDKLGGGMVPSEPRFVTRIDRTGVMGRPQENSLRNRVRDALLWHGAPPRFADRVADAGIPASAKSSDPADILACGLDALISCDPIAARPVRDIILVGPPGHGRTATAAKLTRRAAVADTRILPVAADLDATAGGAQLAAYLELEQDQIRVARTPDDLFELLRTAREEGDRCVIDLPAIVPFDREDMASLKDLIAVIDAEPVLVMSAEGHPDDLADAAHAFADAGVKRAIVSKLDVTRRRGGIVAALSGAGISFAQLGITPFIGGGLTPATPARLSKILLEEASADFALRGAA